MFYLHSRQFMNFEAAKNVILAVSLFFFCISAEIVWGQDYKIKHLQSKLTLSGFDPGPIDGFWGKRTASALAKMLNANGIETSSITKKISRRGTSRLIIIHFHSEKLELEIMHLQKIVDVVDARHYWNALWALYDQNYLALQEARNISDLKGMDATKSILIPRFIYSEHFKVIGSLDYEELNSNISYLRIKNE